MMKNASLLVLGFCQSTKQQGLAQKTNQRLHEEHPRIRMKLHQSLHQDDEELDTEELNTKMVQNASQGQHQIFHMMPHIQRPHQKTKVNNISLSTCCLCLLYTSPSPRDLSHTLRAHQKGNANCIRKCKPIEICICP